MINREQLLYGRQVMRKKLEKEQEEERRRRETNNRIYQSFQSVTHIPSAIPDMKKALEEVRKKSYVTHDEKYLRATGGYNPMKGLKTK
jgi:hypothetical protein